MDWELFRSRLQWLIGLVGVMGTLLAVIGGSATWMFPTFVALLVLVIAAVVADGVFYFLLRGVPWWMIRRDLDRLIQKIQGDGFVPDFVIGAGRAGSIVGAMLAANMGHRPFVALDVQYDRTPGPVKRRLPVVNGPLDLKVDVLQSAQIMVVFAYIKSGDTARAVLEHLTRMGVPEENVRYASLYVDPVAGDFDPRQVFYCVSRRALSGDRWRTTPWHVRKQYDYR